MDSYQRHLVLLAINTYDGCVKCYLLGKLIRDLVPETFTGGDHLGTLCLANTKIPDSLKESKSLT